MPSQGDERRSALSISQDGLEHSLLLQHLKQQPLPPALIALGTLGLPPGGGVHHMSMTSEERREA